MLRWYIIGRIFSCNAFVFKQERFNSTAQCCSRRDRSALTKAYREIKLKKKLPFRLGLTFSFLLRPVITSYLSVVCSLGWWVCFRSFIFVHFDRLGSSAPSLFKQLSFWLKSFSVYQFLCNGNVKVTFNILLWYRLLPVRRHCMGGGNSK